MDDYIFLVTPDGSRRIRETEDDFAFLKRIFELLGEQLEKDLEPARFLSLQDVGRRVGLAATTLASSNYDLPPPDVIVGDGRGTRGWTTRTIDAWWANRRPEAEPVKGLPRPGAWKHNTNVWRAAPAADELALVVCTKGTVKPSGLVLGGPPRTIDYLAVIVSAAWPGSPQVKTEKQIWATPELCERWGLYDTESSEERAAMIADALPTWTLEKTLRPWWFRFATPDGPVLLAVPIPPDEPAEGEQDKDPWRKDLSIYGEDGTDSVLDPEADDAESARLLARRIAWHAELTGNIPSVGWPNAGADVFLSLRAAQRSNNRKRFDATPLPRALTEGKLEPPTSWHDPSHKKKLAPAQLVRVDQRNAYLAAASASNQGYGPLTEHLGGAALELLQTDEPPFGAWLITTPPTKDIGLDAHMPPPHPSMRRDAAATFWATTRTVTHLAEPIKDGGAGLSYEALDVRAAWLQPEQARLLRPWADELRKQMQRMAADPDSAAYRHFVKQMYVAFLGRLSAHKFPKGQEFLHQPLWYDYIRADCRWRSSRFAASILAQHGLRPESADTDSFLYRLPIDVDPYPIFEDTTQMLGKYRIKSVEIIESDESES